MTRSRTTTLTIGYSWDGTPLSADATTRVEVSVSARDLMIRVDAPRSHDVPPDGPPGHVWELWNYEVVELFLLGEDTHYLEVELGPHGHHLVLTLHGVRQIVSRHPEITYQTTRTDLRWSGEAILRRELLPEGPLRANAYRIGGAGPARAYFAAYPLNGAQPDFHQLDTFKPIVWRDLPTSGAQNEREK